MIDSEWTTRRLRVKDSVLDDIPALQAVLESISDTLRLEGKEAVAPDQMSRLFLHEELPPGGRTEQDRLQTISRRDTGEIVGYLGVYHGYPGAGTLYVGTLSIHHASQGQGFGAEVAEGLLSLDGLKDYHTHRLVVTVRNWGAVRFWVRQGFTRVTRVVGDLLSGDGSSARLELARSRPQGTGQ